MWRIAGRVLLRLFCSRAPKKSLEGLCEALPGFWKCAPSVCVCVARRLCLLPFPPSFLIPSPVPCSLIRALFRVLLGESAHCAIVWPATKTHASYTYCIYLKTSFVCLLRFHHNHKQTQFMFVLQTTVLIVCCVAHVHEHKPYYIYIQI